MFQEVHGVCLGHAETLGEQTKHWRPFLFCHTSGRTWSQKNMTKLPSSVQSLKPGPGRPSVTWKHSNCGHTAPRCHTHHLRREGTPSKRQTWVWREKPKVRQAWGGCAVEATVGKEALKPNRDKLSVPWTNFISFWHTFLNYLISKENETSELWNITDTC